MNLKQRSVYRFECGTDGVPYNDNRDNNPIPHYFLILSNNEYNKDNNYVTGIPFTSKKKYDTNWFLEQITQDYIEEHKNLKFLDKATFAMFDRVCRLSKKFLKEEKEYAIFTKDGYEDLIDKIIDFMKKA